MELLRLRHRLILAQRGHKLLEDKLEQMMPKFLSYIKETKELNLKIKQALSQIIPLFIISEGKISQEAFLKALSLVKADIYLEFKEQKIMNVRVPEVKINKIAVSLNYSLQETPLELDVAILRLKDLLSDLIRFSQLFRVCQMLSYEIERTRRRVNALEYLLIPSIIETTSFIEDKLSELERGNLVRLMRVKEIVRSH
jgi:V/A-type H+-transporting ATPase subunit D